MTPTTLKGRPVLLVEVPDDAKDFWIMPIVYKDSTCMLWFNDRYGHDGKCEKLLPAGNWSILLGLQPTEEECIGVVDEPFNEKYYKYIPPGILRGAAFSCVYVFDTALESYASFLRANGFEVGKAILLIKND